MEIRLMTAADVAEVARVDAAAFRDWLWRQKGKRVEAVPRTPASLLCHLEGDPDGSHVVVDDHGRVIGYCFAHTWGEVGWIGPLGVDPAHWGQGLGKALTLESLKYLEARRVSVAGLETMPDTPDNVGLYLKLGLRPGTVRIRLTRRVEQGEIRVTVPGHDFVALENAADLSSVKDGLRELASSIEQGLDYEKEFWLTYKYNMGTLILAVRHGRPVGFSLVHLGGRRGETNRVRVKALVAGGAADDGGVFRGLLAATEALAADQGKEVCEVGVYAKYWKACQAVLSMGYVLEHCGLRMFKWGGDDCIIDEGAYHLCQWTG